MGAEFDQALAMIQKDFSFAGFRRGNVPFDIIEKNNPNELTKVIVNNVVNKAVSEIIGQGHSFYSERSSRRCPCPIVHTPLCSPSFFESEPEVIGEIKLDKATVEFEEFTVDAKMIEYSMKKQIGILESVEGKIQSGDTVTLRSSIRIIRF
jgi:FKBP-type peptidyl-prolyl cis-trans isomerase (trigger factor)